MEPTAPVAPVAAVLAVKRLDDAKTRLAATTTRDLPHRTLVLAMLLDTMAAVREAGIDVVAVISPDDTVRTAAAEAGAIAIDEPYVAATGPHVRLNAAFGHASAVLRERRPWVERIVLIQADLPAATAQSIREVISASAPHRQSLVTDRDGHGTTILIRAADIVDASRFGTESAAAHRMSGAVDLDPDGLRWPDLRTDVDTLADLTAAGVIGLGTNTARVLHDRHRANVCNCR